MRIGWVSEALPYLPSRGGFRLYGANLIKGLSAKHEVHLVSLLQENDVEHLDWPRGYCASIDTIPASEVSLLHRAANFISGYVYGKPLNHRGPFNDLLRSCLNSQKWDVMHVEGSFAGGLVEANLPVAKVLSTHDAEALRAQEMLRCDLPYHEKFRYAVRRYYEPRFERLVYPRYERCIVVAERDLKFNQELVPNARFDLVPYGTDTEYFYPVPVEKQPATLAFHSHLGYPPNIGAATEFADEILPLIRRERPDVVFHLVGASPDPKITALAERPGIRLSSNLPDLRPAVCSAGIYVCAIRYGTGLKSKVLEAMAMRMPIVAYHPGSTVGIECVHGEHLLAAETPQEFAACVLQLLQHPDQAAKLAENARRLVEEKYSWASRVSVYEDLYTQVINERAKRTQVAVAARWPLPR